MLIKSFSPQIPFSEQPKKREERVSMLEKGHVLAEDETTLIGAVLAGQVRLVVNDAEVSAKHARIEVCSVLPLF